MTSRTKTPPQQGKTPWAARAAGALIALIIVVGGVYVIYRLGGGNPGDKSDDPVIQAVDTQKAELRCVAEMLSGKPQSPACRPAAAPPQEEKAK
jgi:hypothetical protein